MAIQLAKELIGIHVVATASRPESRKWCKELGADEVVNHSDLTKADLHVDYILCAADTDDYFDAFVDIINPQGTICSIVETSRPHDIGRLMQKSVTFVWELMFTRSLFETEDMEEQGKILHTIAGLVDEGRIRGTANTTLGEINLENVRKGHELLESRRAIGKVVLGT